MIGKIEIKVEARQIALLLLLQLVDLELRKEHAAFGVIRVRQRKEPGRPNVLFANLFRGHPGQLLP